MTSRTRGVARKIVVHVALLPSDRPEEESSRSIEEAAGPRAATVAVNRPATWNRVRVGLGRVQLDMLFWHNPSNSHGRAHIITCEGIVKRFKHSLNHAV